MSGKTDPGGQWRQVSVVVRSDILLKAAEMGLDISDELNRRLAEIGGIDYQKQPPTGLSLSDIAATAGARDDGTKQRLRSPVLHPVINADDPAAATKVRKAKRQMPPEPALSVTVPSDIVRTVPVPHVSKLPEPDASSMPLVPRVSLRDMGKKSASGKKGKDGDLKKFVSTMMIRTDADDAVVSKEEMYLTFTRWCREHRVATVPDRKVFATLLKNKFAITEKNIAGASCWINIRLR
jgi:hypothetical protein